MCNLFLDDIRTPEKINNYEIVRSYDDFVNIIELKGIDHFNFITLDHDLGDINIPERTGYDCLKYLIGICLNENKKLPQINVHSENIVGVNNIISYANFFYNFSKDNKKCTANKIKIKKICQ